eukprot:gene4624-6797_t
MSCDAKGMMPSYAFTCDGGSRFRSVVTYCPFVRVLNLDEALIDSVHSRLPIANYLYLTTNNPQLALAFSIQRPLPLPLLPLPLLPLLPEPTASNQLMRTLHNTNNSTPTSHTLYISEIHCSTDVVQKTRGRQFESAWALHCAWAYGLVGYSAGLVYCPHDGVLFPHLLFLNL